jgi:hypothetical protein
MPFCSFLGCGEITCNEPFSSKKKTPNMAYFAPIESSIGIRCSVHKESGDVDIRIRKCQGSLQCIEYPIFCHSSYLGKIATLCASHCNIKTDICIVQRGGCATNGCGSLSVSRAPAGSRAGAWCKQHAPLGCIVSSKRKASRCRYPDCKITASFGNPSLWCSDHSPAEERSKGLGLIKKCIEAECSKRARYGPLPPPWQKMNVNKIWCASEAIFCRFHTPSDFITAKISCCVASVLDEISGNRTNCGKQAVRRVGETGYPRFCKKHKKLVFSFAPEKEEDTPEKEEDTPEKEEDTPEKKEDTPEKEEDTSEKDEDTPEKEEDTPEKEEDTPEKEDQFALNFLPPLVFLPF